ncbi:hypothetical protein MUA03_17460 [Enterobacteriaceae bacterium H16N7]|nr:hypothetical protein [Dryocola clanedunensis]
MSDTLKRSAVLTFIALSATGFCLYVGFFSFYLVRLKTSPLIISALIGATALSSVFWGPVAGKLIDRTQYKFAWLSLGQLCCGIFIFLFGNLDHFSLPWTTMLVLCFSLTLNLTSIISNQYLLPLLNENYERCVAQSSRISGIAIFLCGISMAAFYDSVRPIVFFTVSAGSYVLSSLIPLFFVNERINLSEKNIRGLPDKESRNIYLQTFHLLKKHWYLALAMCVLAFAETSFNTNFDVIAFSLGATPVSIVFLFVALSGILGTFASWVYPRSLGHTSVAFRWNFFLMLFMSVFLIAALLAFCGFDKYSSWFIPSLAFVLEIVGIWWSIFIAGRVRACSEGNTYGQTMAAFRVPRSLVTFVGITSIGSALQSGEIAWILLFDTCLLGSLATIYIWSLKSEHKERIATNER